MIKGREKIKTSYLVKNFKYLWTYSLRSQKKCGHLLMMIYTYIIGQKHAIPYLQTGRTGNTLAADELEKTVGQPAGQGKDQSRWCSDTATVTLGCQPIAGALLSMVGQNRAELHYSMTSSSGTSRWRQYSGVISGPSLQQSCRIN